MIARSRFATAGTVLPLIVCLLFPRPVCSELHNPVQKLDLASFKQMVGGGQPYMLVFMAAWCTPCIKELPDLNALHTQYRASGLKMLGVSVDFGGPAAIQPIVDRMKVTFPVIWLGEQALEAYEISGIPLLLFIKNGAVVEKIVGLKSRAFLAKKIELFLAMP
jgi:thiol-disulfide isomerase/thioredoxin